MITIDKLNKFGVDTSDALARLMNNEELYLKLINKFILDDSFNKLKDAINFKNLKDAFYLSHALKGVVGNLSITPLYEIINELTEHLRNNENIDYSIMISRYELLFNKLKTL